MRLSRWLILAALLAIVVFVGQTYIKRQQALARDKPAPPPPLETGIDGRASDWVYTQSDGRAPSRNSAREKLPPSEGALGDGTQRRGTAIVPQRWG